MVTKVIPFGVGSSPKAIVADPDNGVVYVADAGKNTLSVIDTATASVRTTIALGSPEVSSAYGLALDPARKQLYVTNNARGTVAVVDTLTTSLLTTIPHDLTRGIGSSPRAVSVDSELDRAYVTNTSSNSVSVIDTASNAVIGVLGGIAQPSAIAVDLDAHKSYVASDAVGIVTVIDNRTNTVVNTLRSVVGGIGPNPHAVAVDSINHRAYVSDEADRSVTVIDTVTDTVERRFENLGGSLSNLVGLAVDPASRMLFVVDKQNSGLSILDAVSGSLIRNLPRDFTPAPGIRTSPWGVAFDPATSQAFVANWGDASVSVVKVDEGTTKAGVERVSGGDRFEVSASVSKGAFPRGVPVAYVASGLDFPDALSGSAAAGGRGPVLLVKPDGVPSDVARELARLRPGKIVVLGGTASVGAGVEADLATYAPRVERISGADRYVVSAAISRKTFPVGPSVAYVASGQVYADALSGSAAAGARRGPVLLVQKEAIPDAIDAELARLRPTSIVVLGGAASVSDSVLAKLNDIAPSTRIGGGDRYEVAGAVSQSAFAVDTPVAYVASGRVFSDALSGSAAAISYGAPMLIVTGTSVPAPVAAELTRLRPTRIVVLGGPASVSDATLEQLKGYLRK